MTLPSLNSIRWILERTTLTINPIDNYGTTLDLISPHSPYTKNDQLARTMMQVEQQHEMQQQEQLDNEVSTRLESNKEDLK